MTIIEFLLERLNEEELNYAHHLLVIRNVLYKRKLIAMHEIWPVLLEEKTPQIQINPTVDNKVTAVMTQRIQWLTVEEYRKTFGFEPPTAPFIKEMAKLYSDHPDYNPEWA